MSEQKPEALDPKMLDSIIGRMKIGYLQDGYFDKDARRLYDLKDWLAANGPIATASELESERSRARADADPHPEDARREFPVLIAAALILSDGKVLLERRAPTGVVGFDEMWDLPGGKVECGESPAQAVVREIQEELGVNVVIVRLLPTLRRSVWTYADAARHWILAAYECRLAAGQEPTLNERLQWFPLDDLPRTQILTADLEFIEECTEARADVAELVADKARLDWMETFIETGVIETAFELDGGIHLTLSTVGDAESVAYREKNSLRQAIDEARAALAKHSEAPEAS